MRTAAPGLIPLFRSDGQARILAVLFDRARGQLSIGQISAFADVPESTVSREINRLADHGMVVIDQIGRTRLVSANWDLPWAAALAQLLAQTVGLPAVIGRALRGLDGIENAYLFGSWAAREAGEAGPQPNDIDLLVVGDIALRDLREPLRSAEDLAGVYINPTVIDRRRWENLDDPFVATVRDRPMFEVPEVNDD